jgi:hypothetical protein
MPRALATTTVEPVLPCMAVAVTLVLFALLKVTILKKLSISAMPVEGTSYDKPAGFAIPVR